MERQDATSRTIDITRLINCWHKENVLKYHQQNQALNQLDNNPRQIKRNQSNNNHHERLFDIASTTTRDQRRGAEELLPKRSEKRSPAEREIGGGYNHVRRGGRRGEEPQRSILMEDTITKMPLGFRKMCGAKYMIPGPETDGGGCGDMVASDPDSRDRISVVGFRICSAGETWSNLDGLIRNGRS